MKTPDNNRIVDGDIPQKINWDSSKEDQWELLNSRIEEHPRSKQVFLQSNIFKYAAAAVLILLVSFSAFIRFYSVENTTQFGEQATIELPDGSTVNLNDGSQITYKPYWWRFDRSLVLEGEGYFEVEEGSDFVVYSTNGSTRVLGTKFNIYARKDAYRVTCYEGAVRVTSLAGEQAEIIPNEKASISNNLLVVEVVENPENDISWRDENFVFTSSDLVEVLEELERQYNVKIEYNGSQLFYSGSFSREFSISQVLNIIGRTLNLEIEEVDSSTFIMKPK